MARSEGFVFFVPGNGDVTNDGDDVDGGGGGDDDNNMYFHISIYISTSIIAKTILYKLKTYLVIASIYIYTYTH